MSLLGPIPEPAFNVEPPAALRDPRRLAAVRASGLLDAPDEVGFDRLARLAARLLATPIAAVTLVDGDRHLHAGCVGLPDPLATGGETPLELLLCRIVGTGQPVAIADTSIDPRTRGTSLVTEFAVHAYAGVPVYLHGETIGALSVMDRAAREWRPDELDILADLAASVTAGIELRVVARESARQTAALQQLGAALGATSAELREANERLRAATTTADIERRRLEAVLDALPVGVIITDADGLVTHVNQQVAEVCGGAPAPAASANTVYRGWWAESGRAVVPDEWPLARALHAGERVVDEVIDIARLDGRLGTILNSAAPVSDADGQITGGVATVLDVTSRVRSERVLRQLAAAALAITRKRTPDDVLREVTEVARGIIGAHQAATSVAARAGEAPTLSAVSLSEKYAGRAPAAAFDGSGSYSLVCQANAPIRLTQRELERHPAFGQVGEPPNGQASERLPMRGWLAAPLVGGDGGTVGLIQLSDRYDGEFTASDEAVLVQLAQLASAALEKAQADALVRGNAEHTNRLLVVTAALSEAVTLAQVATVVTTAVVDATGAAAASVSVLAPNGREIEILSATGYPEHMVGPWRSFPVDAPVPAAEVIRTGAPRWLGSSAEVADQHPALAVLREAPHFVATAVLPLVAQGRAVGALVLGFTTPQPFDAGNRAVLTAVARQCAQALERARLYDAERRARAAAEAANRAKFDFLATMSHELRTPLNAIGGYVDLMEMGLRGPVTDAQRRDLERVKRAQQHLLGLINDVLNFAKLDAGRVRYAIDDVPAAGPMASVEAMMAPQLRAKGIRYTVGACPPDVLVRADAEKVRQILLNLLSNALKFTEPDGEIALRCEAGEAHVRVRVSDTGMGIPADKLATIFDPFVQVDRGLSRPSEGIGLGLAISRDLAHGMGGELTVESEVGHGSVFTLTLPRG